VSRHEPDLDAELVSDDEHEAPTFELGQVIPAEQARAALAAGFRLTPSWKGAAEQARGVPSAYLVLEAPDGKRLGDEEPEVRTDAGTPDELPEDTDTDTDTDGEAEVESDDSLPARPAGEPARFSVHRDGAEWGIKDRNGGDRWVRLGRNAGVSTSRWDTREEADSACSRLNEATPDRISDWARWGMP
jgi:hypothetical protein